MPWPNKGSELTAHRVGLLSVSEFVSCRPQLKPGVKQLEQRSGGRIRVKYDDASWHYGGDFPDGLPPENGATHIGMFLAWAIMRDLVGELHREESQESLAKVKARQMTGAEFLIRECDEKFTDEDLGDEGNAFARQYYKAQYFDDYCDVHVAYEVEDSWDNFDVIRPKLDERFDAWRAQQKGGGAA